MSDHHQALQIEQAGSSDQGFTLVETVVAMIVIMVGLLGVFHALTYAITFNTGNQSRSTAVAIMQQRVELLRAAKWTSGGMDAALAGGVKPDDTVTLPTQGVYRVSVSVDDDPFVDGINVDTTSPLKEITVTVTLAAPTAGWQFATPVTTVMRRTRGN
jgi:Tfp pilus assembly protein PilV